MAVSQDESFSRGRQGYVRPAGIVARKSTSRSPSRAALEKAQVSLPSLQWCAVSSPFPKPLGPLCYLSAVGICCCTGRKRPGTAAALLKVGFSLPDWHLQGVERILQSEIRVNLIDLAEKGVYPRLPRVSENHEFDPWSRNDRSVRKAELRDSPGKAERCWVPGAARYLSASGSSAA